MVVTEVQRAYATASATGPITATLAASPTPGNRLYALTMGSAQSGPVAGFTIIGAGSSTTNDDAYAWVRSIQSGDGKAYTFQIAGGPWDTELLLVEIAGGGGGDTLSCADSTWTAASTSMPNVAIAAPAGSYVLGQFGLYSGNNTIAPSACTFTNGWAFNDSRFSNSSAGNGSYFVCAHTSFASAGIASTVMTASAFTPGISPQTPYTLVIAAAVVTSGGAVGNSDNPGGAIGNGGIAGGTIGNSVPGAP